MRVGGIKVVAPSSPADVKGLLAAAVRDDDPVLFFEQKSLYATKGEVPDGDHVEELGKAKVLREGTDVTIVALALMVPRALEAAEYPPMAGGRLGLREVAEHQAGNHQSQVCTGHHRG